MTPGPGPAGQGSADHTHTGTGRSTFSGRLLWVWVVGLTLFVLPVTAAAGSWTLSGTYTDRVLDTPGTTYGDAVGSYIPSGGSTAVSSLSVPGTAITLEFSHTWIPPPSELRPGSSIMTRLDIADRDSGNPSLQAGFSAQSEGTTALQAGVVDDRGSLDGIRTLTFAQLDDLEMQGIADDGVSIAPGDGPRTRDVTWTVPEGATGQHLVVVVGGTARTVVSSQVAGSSYIAGQPAITGITAYLYGYSGATVDPVPPKEPVDWTVVIGALAVVGAGIAGGALAVSRRRPTSPVQEKEKKKEREKEEEEGVRYILQLSTATVRVSGDQPVPLEITAWKQEGDGPVEPAPEAVISVVSPAGSGLRISPAMTGRQHLSLLIVAGASAQSGTVPLKVTASAPGGGTETTVTVEIGEPPTMEFY